MTDTPDDRVAPTSPDPASSQPGPSFEAPPGYQFPARFQPAANSATAAQPTTPAFENYSPDAPDELVPDAGPVTAPWPTPPAFPAQGVFPPPSVFPPQGAYQAPGTYPPLANYPQQVAYPPQANYPQQPSYPPQANYPPRPVPYAQPSQLNLNLSGQFAPGYQQPLPDGHRVAQYGRRVAARLIDSVIALSVFFILNAVFRGGFVISAVSGNTTNYTLTSSGWSAMFIIGFLLEVVTVAVLGGQLGKLMMGIRLANATTLATPVGWPSAILRWVISTVALLLCFVPGLLLLLSPLWNQPWRRGWQDRVSNTIVIEK